MTESTRGFGTIALLGSAGIGAGLMYFLDPELGEQRREEIQKRGRAFLKNFRVEVEEVVEQAEALGEKAGEALPVKGTQWTPALRMVASGAGLSLMVSGMGRGGLVGSSMAVGGALLGLRGMTDIPINRLVGIGAGRAAVQLRKVLTVQAPVEKVFGFWTRFENFPKFMEHIRDIQILDENRSHWKVEGPAGYPVEWDAEITRLVPNKAFAWRTLPGAEVEHAGVVRFHPVGDAATRLEVRMSYSPPAGAIGHTVARLFRTDPKTEMDEDLERMKSLLETSTQMEAPQRPAAPAPTVS